MSRVRFPPAEVVTEHRTDDSLLLRSPQALRPYPGRLGDYLVQWARHKRPNVLFLPSAARQARGGG